MKFIKTAIMVAAIGIASVANAQSTEEICYKMAKQDLIMKNILKSNPDSLEGLLNTIQEGDYSPKIKAMLREKAFWVFNRRNLNDDTFHSLTLLRCISSSR